MTNNSIVFFGTIALSTALLSACSVSPSVFYDVDGVPFEELDQSGESPVKISLTGPDTIVIAQGETLRVLVEGDEEAQEALRFDRDGEWLSIARDENVYHGKDKATVTIEMPAPRDLSLSGSGTISSFALASEAGLTVTGSGSIEIAEIDNEEMDVSVTGSGQVNGQGSSDTLDITITGNGSVNFAGVEADKASISITGSGSVELASDGAVSANFTGSGSAVVTGNANCSSSGVGSGSLTCRKAGTAEAE